MRVAFVSLARLGDIINCLPMCRWHHDQGHEVSFLHDARLSAIFSGVTYVKSVSVFQPHMKLLSVVEHAKKSYDVVFNAHPFGPTYHGPFDKPHNVRAWLSCGFTEEQFHDIVHYPLVFDNRCPEREQFVVTRHVKETTKPLLLLNLTAKSSQFNNKARLADAIRKQWAESCEIIDLAHVRAGRFYDVLGLIDRANLLVTVDTSAMHLAAASTTPVVALIGDNEKTAAEPRCNVVLQLKYSEWLTRLKEVHAVIHQRIICNP